MSEVEGFPSKKTVGDLTVCVTMTEAGTVQQRIPRIYVRGETETPKRKPGERKHGEQPGSKVALTEEEQLQVKLLFFLCSETTGSSSVNIIQ